MRYYIIIMFEYIIIGIVLFFIYLFFVNVEHYDHVSPIYDSKYVTECTGCKKCINSRCIYSTLNECKNKCGRACIFCPDGMYMCDIQ